MSLRRPEQRLPPAWVDAWRKDQAHPDRVQGAYLEFLRRRPLRARPMALQVVTWIALGTLLGMGTLYAATNAPWHWLGLGQRVVESGGVPRAAESRPSRAVTPPAAILPAPSAAPSVAAVEPAVAAPTAAASASEQWQRAARGLRERDFETANAALDELARRGTGAERESAQLVRAQLLLSQGRQSEATSELRRLQGAARSAAVRRKAAELLAGLASAPSQRSFSPVEGTNQP